MTAAAPRGGSAKINLLANYAGSVGASLLALAFAPIYIRLLGTEAYGLIGFFTTLTALAGLLDLGLSATLTRELARRCARGNQDAGAATLVGTMELVYVGLGMLCALALAAAGPLIATDWLQAGALPRSTIATCLVLLAIGFGFRWPASLYGAGLTGLERQIGPNLLNLAIVFLQYGGAIVLIAWCGIGLVGFFAYLAACGLLQALILRHLLWAALPPRPVGSRRWDSSALKGQWRFASGMLLISLSTMLLANGDRLIISRMLPLECFGWYVFAGNAAAIMARIATPVFAVVSPRLSGLVGLGDEARTEEFYRLATQTIAVLTMPAATVAVVYAPGLLMAWTHDPRLTAEVAPLFRVLIVGTTFNALMHVPYALQLAHGRTRFALISNCVSTVVLLPLAWPLFHYYGAIGVACIWPLLNTGYLFIAVPIMHRHIARGQLANWFRYGFAVPFGLCGAGGTLLACIVPAEPPGLLPVLMAVIGGLALSAICGLALPDVRRAVLAIIHRRWQLFHAR